MEINTLADIFFASIAHDVERHVMFKRGSEWQVISSRQLYGYVATLARVLKQWGIHKGDRVAILSENRPEWMIADFACVTTGIIDVPIYATLTADQTLYLVAEFRRASDFCFHAGTAAQDSVHPGADFAGKNCCDG